jgi:ATP-dependent DNA ligase
MLSPPSNTVGKFIAATPTLNYEGIVSKKRDSIYLPGRSRSWIEVRNPASAAMKRYEGTW